MRAMKGRATKRQQKAGNEKGSATKRGQVRFSPVRFFGRPTGRSADANSSFAAVATCAIRAARASGHAA